MPRTIWSACFGIDPQAKRQLDGLVELRNFTFCIKGTAASIVCGVSGTAALAAANFFPLGILTSVVQTAASRPPTLQIG